VRPTQHARRLAKASLTERLFGCDNPDGGGDAVVVPSVVATDCSPLAPDALDARQDATIMPLNGSVFGRASNNGNSPAAQRPTASLSSTVSGPADIAIKNATGDRHSNHDSNLENPASSSVRAVSPFRPVASSPLPPADPTFAAFVLELLELTSDSIYRSACGRHRDGAVVVTLPFSECHLARDIASILIGVGFVPRVRAPADERPRPAIAARRDSTSSMPGSSQRDDVSLNTKLRRTRAMLGGRNYPA
jgi:hypothetical protein